MFPSDELEVDHDDVREVLVPISNAGQMVTVPGRREDFVHEIVEALKPGERPTARDTGRSEVSPRWLFDALLQSLGPRDQSDDRWSAVWLANEGKGHLPDELKNIVLCITGSDEGQELAEALTKRLIRRKATFRSGQDRFSPGTAWRLLAVRWGRWVAGPLPVGVRAVLKPLAGLKAPKVTPAPPATEKLLCPECVNEVHPIPILAGMPIPWGNVALADHLGEVNLHGCSFGRPRTTVQCPSCEARFIPGCTPIPDLLAALLGDPAPDDVVPVRPSRTLFADRRSGTIVWTPSASLSSGHWWFAVSPQTTRVLDSAESAVVALRAVGSAVVTAQWKGLREAAPSVLSERVHLRLRKSAPLTILFSNGDAHMGSTS